jgi:hypothetical protein
LGIKHKFLGKSPEQFACLEPSIFRGRIYIICTLNEERRKREEGRRCYPELVEGQKGRKLRNKSF